MLLSNIDLDIRISMIKIKISMNNEQKSFQFFKIIHDFFLHLILIKLIYTLVKQKLTRPPMSKIVLNKTNITLARLNN